MSTELKNTNFFERLRLQLEMPFKLEFCNHWIALNCAMRDFKMVPVPRLESENQEEEAIRLALFEEKKEMLEQLKGAIDRCYWFVGKSNDGVERRLMAWFLVSRAEPFFRFYAAARSETCDAFIFDAADEPPWFNDMDIPLWLVKLVEGYMKDDLPF
jgi:hypothetical protein